MPAFASVPLPSSRSSTTSSVGGSSAGISTVGFSSLGIARPYRRTMTELPDGFVARMDESDDAHFYAEARLVTHIDDGAIAAVGELYDELGVDGDVLDLMSSWISHLRRPPRSLTVLGMNATELDANPMATARVVHDLNTDPRL